MREIKFRGLDLQGNWHYGLLAKTDCYGWTISNSKGLPFAYPIRPETRGQFTGIIDRNNKPVYEGDTVNQTIRTGGDGITEPDDEDTFEGIVQWDKNGWSIATEGINGDFKPEIPLFPEDQFIKLNILGNKYE